LGVGDRFAGHGMGGVRQFKFYSPARSGLVEVLSDWRMSTGAERSQYRKGTNRRVLFM